MFSGKLHTLKLANRLHPMVGQRNRLAKLQVVEHHNRQTAAFHFLRVGVDDILLKMETRAPDVRDARAGGDVASSLHFREEIGLDMHHDNSPSSPIDIVAGGGEIVGLRRVVELEKHAVVHMAELIHVVPTDLQRQRMVEFGRFLRILYACRFAHIILDVLCFYLAAKLQKKIQLTKIFPKLFVFLQTKTVKV